LALNAEQVSGVKANRELPVVWAVAKGSFKNKLILVPLALIISAIAPFLITPLLMIGGIYLCYEGVEKVLHSNHKNTHTNELEDVLQKDDIDILAFENDKIKGAIKTDFILSAEIIVIALGSVKDATLISQIMVVSLIAVLMTAGVYGIVALIVKLDDIGIHLNKTSNNTIVKSFGLVLLNAAPKLMKALSVVGTVAMFLVGGSILSHGLFFTHDLINILETFLPNILASVFVDLAIGIIFGFIALGGFNLFKRFKAKPKRF
jgi:predicted DNA repair protein MutK